MITTRTEAVRAVPADADGDARVGLLRPGSPMRPHGDTRRRASSSHESAGRVPCAVGTSPRDA
ncbi:hypothetical protein [Streptomyces sp. NPDC058698]|uniref:hypothetical protein n=1 Tax=Streptomyces sp. NPDC058698 TaxID=3346606 RepID=UPI00364B3CF8